MSNQVYANNMEVSCKQAAGKSICAFPDVCMTPPQTPATPPGVPIPYPNTGMASDTSDGSTSVKISNQEVMLKNKSSFKKSTGDEAGAAPMKGVVTHKNTGKVFFNAWSVDVKVEGENVVRMLDLTTHNHGSFPGNSPTWPYIDEAAFAADSDHPCAGEADKIKKNCLDTEAKGKKAGELKEEQRLVVFTKKSSSTPIGEREPDDVKRSESMENLCAKKGCREAMKCVVSPYSPNNCCPSKPGGKAPTPHHVVPKSQFKEPGKGGTEFYDKPDKTYNANKAPCICAEGESHSGEGSHPEIHAATNKLTRQAFGVEPHTQIDPTETWTLGEAESAGSQAVSDVLGCPKECIEAQVRQGHKDMKLNKSDEVRPTTPGGEEDDEDMDVS